MTLTHLFHNQGRGSPIGRQQTYIENVLSIESSNLIAYWSSNEQSGTTADNAEGTAVRDGTFTRDVSTMGTETGIGDGNTAPTYTPGSDFLNVYSSSLNTAFDGEEFTMHAWGKVSGAGIWTDGSLDWLFQLRVDANNRAILLKTNVNDQLQWFYTAGGTNDQVVDTSLAGSLDWFSMTMTISKTADQQIAYLNGSQVGSIQTGLGAWTGNLNSSECGFGAQNTGLGSAWSGPIAHGVVWSTALSASNVAKLGVT